MSVFWKGGDSKRCRGSSEPSPRSVSSFGSVFIFWRFELVQVWLTLVPRRTSVSSPLPGRGAKWSFVFYHWGPAKPTSCHVGARCLWNTVATVVQPARAPSMCFDLTAQAAVEDWVGTLDPRAVSSLGAGRKCVTTAPWVTSLCCQSCTVLGHGCPGLTVLSLSRPAIEMRSPRPER